MKRVAASLVVLFALPHRADAQALYAGIRAGAAKPTGDFSLPASGTSSSTFLRGASAGPGYGLDAGFGSGLIGFYGSYDRINFGCLSESCASSGKYQLTGYAAGIRASVPLLPLLKPWAKAGITYNEMKGTIGSGATATPVSTGKSPGYEVGAGVDIPIAMGFLSLSPQVRLIRQRLNPNDAGKRDANYYTFDIGLKVRSPI
jgi:hypothetical protein